MKIAVVQAMCGHVTCAGPDDFKEDDHGDAVNAAISWHIEAGYLPAAVYWVTVELPPVPTLPELQAKAEAGEFPKSFVAEMDA